MKSIIKLGLLTTGLATSFIMGCRYGQPKDVVRLPTGQTFPITYHSPNYATVGTLRQNVEAILDAPPKDVRHQIEYIINTNKRSGVYEDR
ncbi:MAG: hypothetical protein ACMXYF_00980 [Candidatus Woesearchaeota archaeon]